MKKNQKSLNLIKKFGFGSMVMTFCITLLLCQSIFAQGVRGTVSGTVADVTGAVVPNATVTLVDKAKGITVRTVTTDGEGKYQFIEIEPSVYNLNVTAPNFAVFSRTDLRVQPNRNVTINAVLAVEGQEVEVTVTAGEELVDRESATLGTTVDNERIVGLPLNGRNVLSLTLLQPGVVPADSGGFGGGLGIRVNGSRGVENNLTLDGGNNNEVAGGGAIGGTPRPDAVQEFRVLTSNFEAEFGRNTGSIINVVTRSGTNEFHGNTRFFYRPTFLSAAEYFDNASAPAGTDARRTYERKEFGFNIGGPVYFLRPGGGDKPFIYDGRDRTFFFADFERRWQKIGDTRLLQNLPTAAERGGNFSTDPGRTCPNGQIGVCDPATGAPFPGGIIPTNRFSPIAQFYLGFLPAGNAQGQAQVGADEIAENNWFTVRGDHNINQNHLLNFTFSYTDSDIQQPFVNNGGASVPGFGGATRRKTRNHIGRYTWVVNQNMVNYFLINISKNKFPSGAPINDTTPAQIGFTGNFVANGQFSGPPQIRFFDRNLTLGNTIQGPQSRDAENYQIQDSFSWVVGSHRMKFGFDAVKYKQDQDFLFINQGIFTFSGRFGGNTTGDDFADFLIGNSPIAAQYGAAGRRDFRQTAYAGFAQDTWNATKGLTLSMGVRYEYTSPLTDLEDRVAYYRPGSTSQQLAAGSLTFEGRRIVASGTLPNGLVFVGDNDNVLGGQVPRGGVALDKNNFAPRLGFAYSIPGMDNFFGRFLGENRTVIRGGFGVYYGAVIGDTALQQLTAPGYNGTNTFYFPNGGTLADPFAPDPFPNYDGTQITRPNPFTSTTDIIIPSVLAQASQPIDPNIRTPYTMQYNLTFERGFSRDYVLGLSYVGNRGRKQYVREEINPSLGTFVQPGSTAAGTLNTTRFGIIPNITTSNTDSRRLNPSFGRGLPLLTTAGNSAYDSFQVNFQKRFGSDGLTYQLAYTFSKSINDADSQRGGLDIINRSFGRGLSADDAPHRFVGSFIYELPFFKDTTGFLNRLVDGWSINGIYTYQSGDIISIGNPNDTIGTAGVVGGADLTGQAFQTLNPQSNQNFGFEPGAFVAFECAQNLALVGGGPPATGVLGQPSAACPNGFRRGTATNVQFRLDNPINNLDVALVKKTRLFSERNILELRLEAFNALNKTQFLGINTNLNSLFYNTANDPTSGIDRTRTTFGRYTSTRDSRILQLGVRLTF